MSHSTSNSYEILGPTHNLHVEIATALKSADLALFLNHISYWVNYNKRLGRNFHDGRYWTYQTLKELHAHFPYWTEKQLRLIKEKLIKTGILIKGNFNQSKYDQTIWYTIDYEKVKSICPNGQMDNSKPANGISQNDKPIPDNKPDNRTYNIHICADLVDAKKSEKSSLKKEKINKVSRRENIQTSDDEHAKLEKKMGVDFREKSYDHLSEWKKSKEESDPKMVNKHTDYFRILKWVEKEVKGEGVIKQVDETKQWEKDNRDLFFLWKNKYPEKLRRVEYRNGFVINGDTGKDVSVKMNPKAFKEVLLNVLGARENV